MGNEIAAMIELLQKAVSRKLMGWCAVNRGEASEYYNL